MRRWAWFPFLVVALFAQRPAFYQEGGRFHLWHQGKVWSEMRPGSWAPAERPLLPALKPPTQGGWQGDWFDGDTLYRVATAPGGTLCVVTGRPTREGGELHWAWGRPIPIPKDGRVLGAAVGRLYLRRDLRPATPPVQGMPRTTKETRVQVLRFDLDRGTTEVLQDLEIHPDQVTFNTAVLEGNLYLLSNLGRVTVCEGTTGTVRDLVDDFVARLPWPVKRGVHAMGGVGPLTESHPRFKSRIFPDHAGNLCFGFEVDEPEVLPTRKLLEGMKEAPESMQRMWARMGFTPERLGAQDSWEGIRPRATVVVVNPFTRAVKVMDPEAYDHLLAEVQHPLGQAPLRLFRPMKTGGSVDHQDLWLDAKEKVRSLEALKPPAPDAPPTSPVSFQTPP